MRDLKSLRVRRGLSQADLSEKSGVSEFTISEIEAGKRPNARPSTARKLAAGLGVDVADLYGEAMPTPKAQAPPTLAEWLESRCGHAYLTLTTEELEDLFEAAHDAVVPRDAVKLLFDRICQEFLTVNRSSQPLEVKRDAVNKWATAMSESGEFLRTDKEFQKPVTQVLEAMVERDTA